MSELKRYVSPPGGGLFEETDGPLVFWSDHEIEIARLKMAMDKVAERLEFDDSIWTDNLAEKLREAAK